MRGKIKELIYLYQTYFVFVPLFFPQSILQKPCFVTSLRFVITIYCFVEN